jgi:hypothetical protein
MSKCIAIILAGIGLCSLAIAADPPAIVWTDISKEPARIGNVSVKLTQAAIHMIDGTRDGRDYLFDKHLVISLAITNHSDTKKLDYRPWSLASHADSRSIKVQDDLENGYKTFLRPGRWSIFYPYRDNEQSLYPGKATPDTLIYEMPVEKAKVVRISLPAAAVGQTGTYHVEFPVSVIQKR